jgi:hypothetical protein
MSTAQLVSTVGGVFTGDWASLIRYLLWIFVASALLSEEQVFIHSFMYKWALLMVFACLSASVVYGARVQGGVIRTGIFTGGEDGSHSSALLLAGAVLVIFAEFQRKRSAVSAGALLLSLYLLYSLHVSTAQLVIAIPIAWSMSYGRIKIWSQFQGYRTTRSVLICLAMVLAVVIAHEVLINSAGQANQIGSGRLATWQGRISELPQRGLAKNVIGTGSYSDFQVNSVWWWDAKNAHSDLITMIMEFGFMGVVALLFFCRSFLSRCPNRGRGIPIGFFAGCIMSNAFLDRPYIAIWVLAAGITLNDELNRSIPSAVCEDD